MKFFYSFRERINSAKLKWPAIFFVSFLFLLLTIFFSRGYIILGGEGNYFTNFELVRKYGSFAWAPLMNGTGSPNPIINMLIPIFDILALLQKLGASLKVINILMVFSSYIFPFLAMLWMTAGALKLRFSVSFVISLFYIVNPFSTYHLHGLMFWNSAPLFMLPLSFGLLYKYYFEKAKAFLFFGLATSFLAFSFQNPPYLGIFHIFLLLSAAIIPFMRENKINLKATVKYFLLTEISFFLFNSWWLANSFRFYLQETGGFNLKNISLVWSKAYMVNGGGIINYILSFRTLLEPGGYSFFSSFYYHAVVLLILVLPMAVLVFLLFRVKGKKNKVPLAIFFFLLLVIFLNKGAFPPFGNFYQFCIKYIPLFELFKTPLEKFSVLFVFLFSLNLAVTLNYVKNRTFLNLMAFYILVCSIPYLTLNFIPDFIDGENIFISRKFINKKEYINSENILNNHKINYRYLSLPGSKNYQVTMANHGNRYYRGMDPVLYAINKGFIAAYSGDFELIYKNLSQKNFENILSIYNIKKIMINTDIYPSFGFEELETTAMLDETFSRRMSKFEHGPIKVYSTDKFLPIIYIPEHIIVSKREPEEIPRILLSDKYEIRSAVFFESQNSEGIMRNLSNMVKAQSDISAPTVEYKKINPVKYRVRIHKASKEFPLIFSENHNQGWKIYPVERNNSKQPVRTLNGYKIQEEDQATKEELVRYVKNRLVTTLGSEKKSDNRQAGSNSIDFISKNFYGTIQNDNLPNGEFWETWFRDPVANDSSHLIANGYANGWMIDQKEICREDKLCLENSDGTVDFEFILEFSPQRMFYAGSFVTIVTVLMSGIYVTYNWKKYNKNVKS